MAESSTDPALSQARSSFPFLKCPPATMSKALHCLLVCLLQLAVKPLNTASALAFPPALLTHSCRVTIMHIVYVMYMYYAYVTAYSQQLVWPTFWHCTESM